MFLYDSSVIIVFVNEASDFFGDGGGADLGGLSQHIYRITLESSAL